MPQDLAFLVPLRQVQELVAALRQKDVQKNVAALSHRHSVIYGNRLRPIHRPPALHRYKRRDQDWQQREPKPMPLHRDE